MIAWPTKDPNAVRKPHWFDWRLWLSAENDGTISTYEVFVTGPDANLVVAEHSQPEIGNILVRLSGGTVDKVYTVTCRITLSSGRVEDMSRTVHIVEQ